MFCQWRLCYTNVIKDVDDELDDDWNTDETTTHHKYNTFPLCAGSFYIYVPLTQTALTNWIHHVLNVTEWPTQLNLYISLTCMLSSSCITLPYLLHHHDPYKKPCYPHKHLLPPYLSHPLYHLESINQVKDLLWHQWNDDLFAPWCSISFSLKIWMHVC